MSRPKPSATDQPTRPTQPYIRSGSINRVPALIGYRTGGNVTSAGWQVTWCDPIWHVSSLSGKAFANCYYGYFTSFTLALKHTINTPTQLRKAGITRDQFSRSILVTSSRGFSRGCQQQVGRVGEDVTRMLRGNCCRALRHMDNAWTADDWCNAIVAHVMTIDIMASEG